MTGHYQHKCEVFKGYCSVLGFRSMAYQALHIIYMLEYVYPEKNLRRIVVLLTLLQNLYQDNYAEQESHNLLKVTLQ